MIGDGEMKSVRIGDVPERLRRRYYLDERGGPGLGFYSDARVTVSAFRDRGGRLIASRTDPNAIRDMTAIAQHRGWRRVVVQGDREFRREAWLAAESVGIVAAGYRATERDKQELQRRQLAAERRAGREIPAARQEPDPQDVVRTKWRIIETVVRHRAPKASDQQRILDAARDRLSRWLEQGAPLNRTAHGKERSRSRE